LIIALVLFVVWVVGFGFFRTVVGGAIHIILLIAVIALAWHFIAGHSGRGAAPTNATSAIDPGVRGGLA
jgi:hypothetical protein